MSYIFSTCMVLFAFQAYHVPGKKVILMANDCAPLFERSVEDPNNRTTIWTPNQNRGNGGCSICNSQDAAPSWLVTKLIPAGDSKRIHVSVTMYRSDCKDCKNQDVKVYILYKALALDRSKAASILKSLPLVVNLSNGKDRTEKIHTFHFEPKTRKFSIVLQSAGSCTLIKDITVSYSVCDKNVSSLANLPRTVAPANGSKRVNFSCPDKSVNPDGKEVYGLCSSEGLWKIISPCTPKKGNASSVEGKGIARLSQEKYSVIQIENQPFKYECTLTGTDDELENSEIMWATPDKNLSDILIPQEGDSYASITVKKGDGKVVSTLHVRKPPNSTVLQYYRCKVTPPTPGKINQFFFSINILKEKAVPKMELKTKLEPAKFRETVVLNCSVSYDNENFYSDYKLILSWKKAGKPLAVKTYRYKLGNNVQTLRYSVLIKDFNDAGEYVCSWELKSQGSSISRNSTVDLSILHYLAGPPVKEVLGISGNNVTLVCDVVGYPIMFEWRDEMNNLLNGSDSRFRTEKNLLYIDDMNYEDRQKYKCLGIGGNKTLLQTIILRVKGASSRDKNKNGKNAGISVAGVLVLVIMSIFCGNANVMTQITLKQP